MMISNDPNQALCPILDAVDHPVIALDLEGLIVCFNRACEKLTGYDANFITGEPLWRRLLDDEDRAIWQARFMSTDPGAVPTESAVVWLTAQGQALHVTWRHQLLPDESGMPLWVIFTLTHVEPIPRHEFVANHRFRQLVETIQQGIAITDDRGRVIYHNHALAEQINQGESVLLHHLGDYMDSVSAERYQQHHLDRRADYQQLRFSMPDGASLYCLLTAVPDDVGGFFEIFTDITPLKRTEDALRHSNEELDAFAHTVAHDLKNPLGVLLGFADMLSDAMHDMSESEIEELMQVIGQTTAKMINIIDELLLLAEMRHVDVVPQETLNTRQLVYSAANRLDFMREQYGATLLLPDDGYEWPAALGYAPWVEEVWVNYLSNAIKYGGQPATIEVGATLEDDAGQVRFWVRDNGRGIPEEKIPSLFTPFTRLESLRAKGHGLGLSIVQRIVHKLGGQVKAESAIGQGSVFSFTLPQAPDPSAK